MKFFLKELVVGCKREKEVISFSEFNYFYGQMGSGKSTIARLIDFCLGGDIELTPALQSEFVYAALTLEIENRTLFIKRDLDATNVTASYKDAHGEVVLGLPLERRREWSFPALKWRCSPTSSSCWLAKRLPWCAEAGSTKILSFRA
jgi:hypothetical protein